MKLDNLIYIIINWDEEREFRLHSLDFSKSILSDAKLIKSLCLEIIDREEDTELLECSYSFFEELLEVYPCDNIEVVLEFLENLLDAVEDFYDNTEHIEEDVENEYGRDEDTTDIVKDRKKEVFREGISDVLGVWKDKLDDYF